MNIYQNTQIGGLIHKLSKYQTLLARASPSKANIYASKVNSYKSQLAAIGYGGNQEGGAYVYTDGKIMDGTTEITPDQLIAAASAKNKEFQDGADVVGVKYNNLIVKLTDVFAEIARLQTALETANQQCIRSQAETAEEQAKREVLEREKAAIEAKLATAQQQVRELEAELEAAQRAAQQADAVAKAAEAAAADAKRTADAASDKERARLQAAADQLQIEATRAREEAVEAQKVVQKLERSLQQAQQQLQQLTQELQRLTQELDLSRRAVAVCNANLAAATAQITDLRRDLEAAQAQVQTATGQILTLANAPTQSFVPPRLERISAAAPAGLSGHMLEIFNMINAQATPSRA